jgi:hypothetical protein
MARSITKPNPNLHSKSNLHGQCDGGLKSFVCKASVIANPKWDNLTPFLFLLNLATIVGQPNFLINLQSCQKLPIFAQMGKFEL